MINALAQEIHENARKHGFYESAKNTGEMLCLIHSEVSEALEADRNNHYAKYERLEFELGEHSTMTEDEHWKVKFENHIKNTFEDELADIMIRVMDMAAFRGIDLENHIKAKMRYNAMREHKHGKKY